MGFKLLPAVVADADDIGAIFQACSTGPRNVLEAKNVKPADALAWWQKTSLILLSTKHPAIEHWKLIDEETGEIAAFVQWGFAHNVWDIQFEMSPSNPPPPGWNVELRKKFISGILELAGRTRLEGECYHLMELITLPKFQRRGAGAMLCNIGIEKADRDGVPAVVQASPQGAPLYKKLGFVEIDKFVIPLEVFGGVGEHTHLAMIRKPQLKSSTENAKKA